MRQKKRKEKKRGRVRLGILHEDEKVGLPPGNLSFLYVFFFSSSFSSTSFYECRNDFVVRQCAFIIASVWNGDRPSVALLVLQPYSKVVCHCTSPLASMLKSKPSKSHRLLRGHCPSHYHILTSYIFWPRGNGYIWHLTSDIWRFATIPLRLYDCKSVCLLIC